MGLVRSLNAISQREKHFSSGYMFRDGVMIMAVFRTKADVVRRALPPPLEPAPTPTGLAYMTELRKTNFGVSYSEAGLFISAQYQGEVGKYCLSMPVTDDMALVWGREIYGYPKKIAETITVKREGNKVTGVCIRKGIRIIEITANLNEKGEPGAIPPAAPNYLFKHSWNPKYPIQGSFDYHPRLIKHRNEIDWGKL